MIDKAFSVSPPQVELKELKNKKTANESTAGPKEFESYLKSSGGIKKKAKDENEKAAEGFKKDPRNKLEEQLAVQKPKSEKVEKGDDEKVEIKKKKIDGTEAALNLMVSKENENKVPDSDKDLVLASENLQIKNTKTQMPAVELAAAETIEAQPQMELPMEALPVQAQDAQPVSQPTAQQQAIAPSQPQMVEMTEELQQVQPPQSEVPAEVVMKPQDESSIPVQAEVPVPAEPKAELPMQPQTKFEGEVRSSLTQEQFNRHLEGLKGKADEIVPAAVQQPMVSQKPIETIVAAPIQPQVTAEPVAPIQEQILPVEGKKVELKIEAKSEEKVLPQMAEALPMMKAEPMKKEASSEDSPKEKSEKETKVTEHVDKMKVDAEAKAFHVGHDSFKNDLGVSAAVTGQRAEGTTQAQTQAKLDNLEGMQNLMNQAQYLVKRGGGEVSVQMTPEGLGKVHLKMMIENGNVQLELSAQDHSTKKLIEEHISDLKSSLAAHQMNVEHVKINTVVETNTENKSNAFDTRGGSEQHQPGQFAQNGSSKQSFSERRNYQPEKLESMTQVNLGNLKKATAKRVYENHKANALNRVA